MKDFFYNLITNLKVNSLQNNFAFFACLIFGILIFFVLGMVVQKIISRANYAGNIKKTRKDAIKRSRAVINGQMVEQVAPFLPEFPCNPADVRFIGKPVDFIGFKGMSDGNEIEEVLLIEIKTGSSQLSSREKEIKKAIQEGRFKYVEYRMF